MLACEEEALYCIGRSRSEVIPNGRMSGSSKEDHIKRDAVALHRPVKVYSGKRH